MFEVTANAIDVLRSVTERENCCLRVSVVAGGCAGVRYWMSLEDDVRSGDVVYVRDGIRFVVDGDAAPLLTGATVDFVKTDAGGGFVFENPDFAGRCSCSRPAAVAAE